MRKTKNIFLLLSVIMSLLHLNLVALAAPSLVSDFRIRSMSMKLCNVLIAPVDADGNKSCNVVIAPVISTLLFALTRCFFTNARISISHVGTFSNMNVRIAFFAVLSACLHLRPSFPY